MVISERDLRLFRYLFEKKCASISQIQRDIFKGCSYGTVRGRLWRLCRGEVVQKKMIADVDRIFNVYSLSKQGLDRLRSNYPYVIDSTKLQSDKPLHDLALVDIDTRIESMSYLVEYFTENALFCCDDLHKNPHIGPFFFQRSDRGAILKFDDKFNACAFEFEKTAKSRGRYEDKLTSYRENTSIDFVFYICEDPNLMKYLVKIEKEFSSILGSKVYFSTLHDFLNGEGCYLFESCEGKKVTLV